MNPSPAVLTAVSQRTTPPAQAVSSATVFPGLGPVSPEAKSQL